MMSIINYYKKSSLVYDAIEVLICHFYLLKTQSSCLCPEREEPFGYNLLKQVEYW